MGAAPNDPRGTCRCGLLDDELLSFSEERRLPYIVVARMTKWVQSAAQRVEQWPEGMKITPSANPLTPLHVEDRATLHRGTGTRARIAPQCGSQTD